ncbi:hypothetical protein CQW23_24879 [Capsicum baccatum]|uniref:Disease resistance protein At4g27190-like leucine-rich repeats domain-containing protein n=1 Tax=Capsicum baccatum TaxID=33114 RepID=A0A2G2VW03_CAPBA|nr:hypothetical protein CQW23_24879 [Capsicum baccatum]
MHDVVRDVAIHVASEGKHKFMVNHNMLSGEFPRRDSYEQYSHMSIAANRFDERPRPISCPRLELLMIKLVGNPFKLQDDFFDGMRELSVISLRGGYLGNTMLPFPSSIQRLSNVRTLCLVKLSPSDMSIIGELVTLEILSIRLCYLEELPVEIGNLANLIMLDFGNIGELTRISPGVLSRLVRLEELHVVGVEDCSYSTLRELESLSRLTALTLHKCSLDVIYSNLGLSSKLTRGKGSKNVVVELQNVKDLRLADCDSLNIHCRNNILFTKLERLKVSRCDHLRHLFCVSLAFPCDEEEGISHEEEGISRRTHIRPDVINFPNLYRLELDTLAGFIHFSRDTVEGIEFSLLREMHFQRIPEFQNFWPRANNAITDSNPLFNEKVSCPNLEVLCICAANSISALCSHQLPTAYFSKLVTLEVRGCGILRNLMPPSVARGLLNLRTLLIDDCQSMEEVITEEEQRGGEIVCNEPLFPLLEKLELDNLRKLGHFILMKGALEFPFLIEVMILECPEMDTFIQQGTVSTLNLESVNDDDELKVVDLNKAIFNSKISCPSLEKLSVNAANNITALCSHQLPIAYFSKLKELTVNGCGKLRNLMSPSVARGLLNIRELRIKHCPVMEEMITEKEQEGEEIMTNETVFPRLEKLNLSNLPKLGHFILTNGALEFPFLIEVNIRSCPKMKTFIHQGTVSTLNVGSVNNDDVLKVVDLNKAMFNSKVFDWSRASEYERELLFPDACGKAVEGWISRRMATYGRGHGTRETVE